MNTPTIIVFVVFAVLFVGVIIYILTISHRLKKLRDKLDEEEKKE